MPAYVRGMITVFVAIPAGLARIFSIGMAWATGTFWLSGYQESFMRIPIPLAFLGLLVVSAIFYLILVGVDYVLAKHRDTVPRNTVIQCLVAELSVQVFGILAGSMLVAAFSNDGDNPLLLTFGLPLALAALTVSFVYNRRVKEWRAAWSGDYSIIPAPAEDGKPVI